MACRGKFLLLNLDFDIYFVLEIERRMTQSQMRSKQEQSILAYSRTKSIRHHRHKFIH